MMIRLVGQDMFLHPDSVDLLRGTDIEVMREPVQWPDDPTPTQNEGNLALQWATQYSTQWGLPVLAECISLQVGALGGAPGVHWVSWLNGVAMAHVVTDINYQLCQALLGMMRSFPRAHRRHAVLMSSIALAVPKAAGTEIIATGVGYCHGRISDRLHHAAGRATFYEGVFMPGRETHTISELDGETRKQHSARREALGKIREQLLARNITVESAVPGG